MIGLGLSLLLGACEADPTSAADTSAPDVPDVTDATDATDETDETDVSDTSADTAVVHVTCGTADPIAGNLSWPVDVTAACTHYLGSVHLPDTSDSAAFAPLRELLRIDGSLTVFRPHTEVDLTQLERLEAVGGVFSFRIDDASHTALSGPPRLREVGHLTIESNGLLERLDGFAPALETVHGDLRIRHNPKLSASQVETFLDRVTVGGAVLIEGNGDGLP